mmetsp:Transcript_17285/g.31007  ORF Transcript_17285/g.31007 Transcript_17285/m.31007 type:complete len:355 (-) Transcript_17285:468-1532(-)
MILEPTRQVHSEQTAHPSPNPDSNSGYGKVQVEANEVVALPVQRDFEKFQGGRNLLPHRERRPKKVVEARVKVLQNQLHVDVRLFDVLLPLALCPLPVETGGFELGHAFVVVEQAFDDPQKRHIGLFEATEAVPKRQQPVDRPPRRPRSRPSQLLQVVLQSRFEAVHSSLVLDRDGVQHAFEHHQSEVDLHGRTHLPLLQLAALGEILAHAPKQVLDDRPVYLEEVDLVGVQHQPDVAHGDHDDFVGGVDRVGRGVFHSQKVSNVHVALRQNVSQRQALGAVVARRFHLHQLHHRLVARRLDQVVGQSPALEAVFLHELVAGFELSVHRFELTVHHGLHVFSADSAHRLRWLCL